MAPVSNDPTFSRCNSCQGSLRSRVLESARRSQLGPPRRKLLVGHQHIGGSFAQVDTDSITGPQQCRFLDAAASGDALRIDGDPEVPDCRPSPMQGSAVIPCLIKYEGGRMLTTSAAPG